MGLLFSKALSQDDDKNPAPAVVPEITTRRIKLCGIWCTVSAPKGGQPHFTTGLTFLIPGAMLSESSYQSTRNVLHAQHQVVISFYVNVFTKSHDDYAAAVPRIFDAFCRDKNNHQYRFKSYSIVGHSVGAKIGLLVVSAANNSNYNNTTLHTLVALDPVDDHPPEFTNTDAAQNHSLVPPQTHKIQTHPILVTFANATPTTAIPPAHNAQSIVAAAQSHGTNKNTAIQLQIHKDAAHMCYTDNGGGIIFGWIMKGGTPEGNQNAKIAAHNLIRTYIGRT